MKTVFFVLITLFLSREAKADFEMSTKHAMEQAFTERVMPLGTWISQLNSQGYDLLCLGETHNDYYRELYSTKVFSTLEADVLAVESNQVNATLMMEEYYANSTSELKVTGAPYRIVLDSFLKTNTEGEVIGVEPSDQQTNDATLAQMQGFEEAAFTRPSRDSFIATNIAPNLETSNLRTVALYGSSHCTYFENGLGFDTPFMRFLMNEYGDQKRILSLHILEPEEEHLLKIYLKGFGLLEDGTDQVLINTRSIDPAVYNYRVELYVILQSYDVIYFPAD